jgi:glutathionylspermidine synthase
MVKAENAATKYNQLKEQGLKKAEQLKQEHDNAKDKIATSTDPKTEQTAVNTIKNVAATSAKEAQL